MLGVLAVFFINNYHIHVQCIIYDQFRVTSSVISFLLLFEIRSTSLTGNAIPDATKKDHNASNCHTNAPTAPEEEDTYDQAKRLSCRKNEICRHA